MSSKRSKRARHAAISSLLITKSDEDEPGCFLESDIELAANSLMMFANARDGSFLSNRQDMAAVDMEEPNHSFKLDRRKKRVRTKKLMDTHFDSCVDQEMKYKCKTCPRKFSSFQALGGHRASCSNKFKSSCHGSNNMYEEIEDLTEETIDYEDDLQSSSLEDRRSLHIETGDEGCGNRAKPAHECPVCYRVFSSGQALGGHKRCHSTPPAAAAPVGLDNSPCLSTIEEHLPVKPHGLLDLNMPPPLEEEDYWIGNYESVGIGSGVLQVRGSEKTRKQNRIDQRP
jgi:hypothetical protein